MEEWRIAKIRSDIWKLASPPEKPPYHAHQFDVESPDIRVILDDILDLLQDLLASHWER